MQARNEALEKSLAESINEKGELKARVAELGRSLHHHQSRNSAIELKSSLNKIEEMKGKIEELESVLHSCELRIELLETREGRWKEELHHSHDQVRSRDYLMGEAIVHIREVTGHLQTLAVQANTLSTKYELQSDRGQELALLFRKIRTLGLRAKAYLPQQGQADNRPPMNFQVGSGSNPGDNPANLVIPDLDIAEREGIRIESSRQLEDRCRWLEEKFKALGNADNHHKIDAKDLSLVPDLVLPHKFKMLEFEKYNGTSCPEAHITMFCRQMTGYVNNDQLLIHYFQGSLVGVASRCFKQYAQRWREVAIQVQPPLLEKETTMLFINTLKAPFITHMIGNTTKSFADIVMAGEMIENAIRGGKIEAGETNRRSVPKKKDNEYDSNAQCDYNVRISGHSIENYTAFKKVAERLIKMGFVKFDDTPSSENPLPNHGDKGINAIGEDVVRRTKGDISEVKTSLRMVWREMMRRGLIESDSVKRCGGIRDYCEFHKIEEHKIQECAEFRVLVQSLMDNKEVEFYEEGSEEGNNYDCNVMTLGMENSTSTSKEVQNLGFYKRSGRCYNSVNVRTVLVKAKTMVVEQEKEVEVLINKPVKKEEAKEFLKFLKHNEYSMVEQLRNQPTCISVLALLLSSEVHREALMKALNETYVTKDISVNKLDCLVSNISADNFISFSDDEIPPRGMGSTNALQITNRCNGYTLPSVLIDNGSALNVLPLSTLKSGFSGDGYQALIQLLAGKALDSFGRSSALIAAPKIEASDRRSASYHKCGGGHLATVTNDAPYAETNEETIECSFRSLEFINATFILEGNEVPVPKISKTTRMGLQMMVGKGALPGKGLGEHLQGEVQVLMLKEKRDHFGLGFRPDAKQKRREIEKK
ncbi:Gag-pro-like protein [Gossypium australe]|uniref:Gag-pro-like protein n=1 Tax=Gossypium australe TaxID=47621 RepID=A0A5B6VEM5_9ROSI|nr:Gag-pro-like protein [Gossypium australe]